MQLSRSTESMERSRGELITVAAALSLLLKDSVSPTPNGRPASAS